METRTNCVLVFLLLIQSAMATNMEAVAQGNTKFSQSFMKALASEEGNLISSPLSCLIALAMVHAGAKGQTASIMSEGLFLPTDLEKTRHGFSEIISKLKSASKVELAIANKIFVKENFAILPEFVDALNKSFSASAQNVNFLDTATVSIINDWVSEQTKDKIKDLIQPGSFDDMTRLVLVNAVYFKGPWLHPFDPTYTSDRAFFTDDTNSVEVPFMYQKKYLPYAVLDDLDAQILELPYEGRELSLVIILPNKKTGLAELEAKLATKDLNEILQKAKNTEVEVYLPKFKVESTLDLKVPLAKMGLDHIFSGSADFSGISTAEPLKVSRVIQKAFIEVSEEGTEAAAATAAIVRMRRCIPEDPIIFEADHPFVFNLVCSRNESPLALFSGKVLALQSAEIVRDEL